MNTAVSDSLWKHRRWSRRDVFFLIDNMKCWDALFKRQSEVVSWSFKREVSVRFPNFQSVNPQCDSNGISTSQIITTVFYQNLKIDMDAILTWGDFSEMTIEHDHEDWFHYSECCCVFLPFLQARQFAKHVTVLLIFQFNAVWSKFIFGC